MKRRFHYFELMFRISVERVGLVTLLAVGMFLALALISPHLNSTSLLTQYAYADENEVGGDSEIVEEQPAEEAQPENEEQAEPEGDGDSEEEAAPELIPEEQASPKETPIQKPPLPYTHPVRQLIPEAFILPTGFVSLAYLNRSFDEDSIASQGGVDSQGYRIDYGLSDRVQIGLRLWQNNTNNGRAIYSPFWDNTLTADMWETDLKLFLSGTPRPEAGVIPADKLPSAFTIGVSHQDTTLSREQADDDLRVLTGYVSYSAYLNPQLSTHTYFSTGRFTGDLISGTMNTLAAGIDYDLLSERDKLRLSLDGALDIYNFRQTSFSATRVSHVNVGLKYMVSPQVELTLGYGIHTDSESDLSSTEFQFGLSFFLDALSGFGGKKKA